MFANVIEKKKQGQSCPQEDDLEIVKFMILRLKKNDMTLCNFY